MESTSVPGRIQLSSVTADLLMKAGKDKWITEREDAVIAKGLGKVKTFWFRMKTDSVVSSNLNLSADGSSQDFSSEVNVTGILQKRNLPERCERLVQWNAEVLLKQMKNVVARRLSSPANPVKSRSLSQASVQLAGQPLDEVQDVLTLPHFDASVYEKHVDPSSVDIPKEVSSQVHDYVRNIASMYRYGLQLVSVHCTCFDRHETNTHFASLVPTQRKSLP